MTNNGIKKTAAAIACLIILAVAAVFIIDALSDDFNVVFYPETSKTQQQPGPDPMPEPDPTPEPEPSLVQLAAPEIAYDQETNVLSWNEVENASGYRVTVNDKTEEYTSDVTETEVFIAEGEAYSMSVVALGDGEKYSDSIISTVTGERANLEKMYYEQIEKTIKSAIENKNIAFQKFNIMDIVNIDIKDNKLVVTTISNSQLSTEPAYRIFDISLDKNYDVSSLEDLANAVNYISNNDSLQININKTYFSVYSFENDCYNKLINDSLLDGELKNYIDNGYEAFKIYSFVSNGNSPQSFIVNSCIKLQKGNDIKVVTVQNKISQKYNGSYAFDGYVNAYIVGTAEDVEIEEIAFTEASPVSSVWQAANDKYGSQQAQVTNS